MSKEKNNKKDKKAKKIPKEAKVNQPPKKIPKRVVGLLFVLVGLFGGLKQGFLGTLIANVLRTIGGNTYILLSVVLSIYGLFLIVKGSEPKVKRSVMVGSILFYLGILLWLHTWLFQGITAKDINVMRLTWQKLFTDIRGNIVTNSVGGGLVGALLYSPSRYLVAQLGSYISAIALMAIGLSMASNLQMEKIGLFIKNKTHALQQKLTERRKQKELKKTEKVLQTHEQESLKKNEVIVEEKKNKVRKTTPGERLASEAVQVDEATDEEVEQLSLKIENYQRHYQEQKQPILEKEPDHISVSKAPSEQSEEVLEFEIPEETEDRDYQLPPSSLLNAIPLTDQSDEYAAIENNVSILERTFTSFGVDAKVVRASLGPAVTKYEIQPAVGVKVSKIVSLTDDIALALAAKDIRMEAPIPGKSLIGIEVPNNTVSMVSFRDIVEAHGTSADHLLEVPLGRDISGAVITADLVKMPHLLIAGSTGSGKSVCINGIIISLLMAAKPHEVKLMMIDPKMVELNVYNGIPHLLTPVVTNPRKAAQALQKVVQEMERRYELFAASGVRNVDGYNQMVIENNLTTGQDKPVLPYIVVIVDELADLMMVASNEVEDAITRLAQMARAAGIHMILATQRPSVDVITGIIKANVPSRIAFAVSSGTDSRTIIDSNGAEKLLGRGDMLFLPMGENKPIRVQGAFISDQEVEQVVAFICQQQGANYQENMMPEETTSTGVVSQDDLYDEAANLVVEMDTASISLLQRKLRIGYNRAARLIDELEENGVVGPSEGSKPRKVIGYMLPEEQTETPLEEMDNPRNEAEEEW